MSDPVPVRSISFGEYAFANSKLETLDIPSTITVNNVIHPLHVDMSNNAFNGISTLSSVVLSEAVTQIIASVFSNCENLSQVSVSSQIIIDKDAFDGSYTDIVLTVTPTNDSTEIIANFIRDNLNIGTLVISDGITTIGSYAAYGSNVKRINFSNISG